MRTAWADIEAGFARALLNRDEALLRCLVGHGEPHTDRGFEVYRTNYGVNLQEALRATFPVTAQLVGQEFFAAMTSLFVRSNPPRSPVMIEYGRDLPAFIDQFAPASVVPYLADVARLELAWNDAYHAPDSTSLSVAMLQASAADELAMSGVQLHPSTRLLCSDHPVASIWSAHQASPASLQDVGWTAEEVLIVRPAAEVLVFALKPGCACFYSAIGRGESIEQAAGRTLDIVPAFDPGSALLSLVTSGAVSGLTQAHPLPNNE